MKRAPDHAERQDEAEPGIAITLIVLFAFVFVAIAIALTVTLGRWLLIPVIGLVGYFLGRWRKWW